MTTPLLDEPLGSDYRAETRQALEFLAAPGLERDLSDPFLLRGSAAHALLFHHLARFDPGDRRWRRGRERAVDALLDGLAEADLDLGFLTGLPGAAWVLRHLEPNLGSDLLEPVDEILHDAVAAGETPDDPSPLFGFPGIGLYALEGTPRQRDRDLVEAILRRVAETARYGADGVFWMRPTACLPAEERDPTVESRADLGLVHGCAGMLAFLIRCLDAGFDGPCHHLARGALEWILSQRLPNTGYARYPYCLQEGREPFPAGGGLLGGELAIASTALRAARALGQEEWELEARRSALATWAALPATTIRGDYSLLTGLLGEARILGRLEDALGEPALRAGRDARLRLVVRSLLFWRDAGRTGEPDGPGLAGGAGAALALLSALRPDLSAWDRVLLLS